jgi:predicted ester cyclase
MSTEETKSIVLKMVQSGNVDGDVDAAISAYEPDFTYHNAVMKEMPPFEHTTDAVRQLFEATRTAFPDMRYTIDSVIAEGDRAAVLYTWSGTNRGELAGAPPTRALRDGNGSSHLSRSGGAHRRTVGHRRSAGCHPAGRPASATIGMTPSDPGGG